MQNLTIGTDIVEFSRIHRIYNKYGVKFAEKILHKDELQEFKNTSKTPSQFLAKRFAVKEASVKALGTGFRFGVSFKDITLFHDRLGKPCIKFDGEFAKIAAQKQLQTWQVSISDTDNLVIAFVVACSNS